MSLPHGISRDAVDLLHRMIDLGGLYACECNRTQKRHIVRLQREGFVDLNASSHWDFAHPTPKGRAFAKEHP